MILINPEQNPTPMDKWDGGSAYERYIGRWSRSVAREFLNWLDMPSGSRWLDVGCGTGALSHTILSTSRPLELKGIDLSEPQINFAREHVVDPHVTFEVGSAQDLPLEDSLYDAVVSALMLNFLPDPPQALREMVRVAKPDGVIAVYVWDYAGRMEMIRSFWDAATAVHPQAKVLDEGLRFPLCQPEPLTEMFQQAGLENVEVRSIDITTHFRDFEDYWMPFEAGQGPAPAYVTSLAEQERTALRHYLLTHLPIGADGSITLTARAWAVRGYKPPQ